MYDNAQYIVQTHTCMRYTEEQLRVTLAEVDASGTGSIGYTEFRAAVRHSVSVLVGGAPAANATDYNTTATIAAAAAAGSATSGTEAAASSNSTVDAEASSTAAANGSDTAVLEINNGLAVPLLGQQQVH
jgi:transcription elongation factor